MRVMRRDDGGSCGQAGVSLLEVLIAVSLLGICFSAIFSGLATSLRSVGRLEAHDRAVEFATRKLNEMTLDGSLRGGEVRSGTSDSGLHWRARAQVEQERPGPAEERPVQLVRLSVEVSWRTLRGEQSFTLETLKLRIPEGATK